MRHVTSPIWGAPVADPGEGSAPLKNFFGDRAPLLSQGLEDRPHPPAKPRGTRAEARVKKKSLFFRLPRAALRREGRPLAVFVSKG